MAPDSHAHANRTPEHSAQLTGVVSRTIGHADGEWAETIIEAQITAIAKFESVTLNVDGDLGKALIQYEDGKIQVKPKISLLKAGAARKASCLRNSSTLCCSTCRSTSSH